MIEFRLRKNRDSAVAQAFFLARKTGDWKKANVLSQQAQCLPSTDPNDSNYRRLWYVRYAYDFLLGISRTYE